MRLFKFLLALPLLLSTAAAAQTGASLSFNGDWTVSQSSDPLPVGSTVAVTYDANRLPGCRGTTNTGGPAWSITGYYSLNGGPVQSFWVAGHSPDGSTQSSFALPANTSGDLAMWFQVTNMWGCSEWDSNYEHNYHFNVGNPSIAFTADWNETVYGTLKSGKTFIVNYDLSRLPDCRQTYNGAPTWEIVVEYRIDGGPIQNTPVTRVDGFTRLSNPTPITAPAGARTVEMWFKNTDRASCVRYDSNFGQNYRFTLQ